MYQLTDDTALVQSVDFFPPIVDDPYVFGQVAAANALSDVYAMGGRPLTALNVLCFPVKMPLEQVGDILRGGADKVAEAGAIIVGGHSIKDDEVKYGLAVTGLIHPGKIITNSGAKPGDRLILTKPLGTGIIATAVKKNKAEPEQAEKLNESMAALNNIAGESMIEFGVHAATDVTGFGLAGHAYEMANGSGVSIEIIFERLRLLPGAIAHAQAGALTPGGNANQCFLENKVEFASSFGKYVYDIVYDAQTSGGLLMALPEDRADDFLNFLRERNVEAVEVGKVIPPIRPDRRDRTFIFIK